MPIITYSVLFHIAIHCRAVLGLACAFLIFMV